MSRNLASLIAGFGTGYFTSEKQKRDEERQAKLDKIQEQQAEREQLRFETEQKDRENKALTEQKMREAAMPTNASKTNLDAAGLQQAMPKVFAEADPTNPSDTMTGEEKAKTFLENSTPEQRLNNASFYAQQGVTALGDKKIVQGDQGQIATVDPKQDKQKPRYKILEDQAHILIQSGKPENISTGNQMIMQSAMIKSDEYKQKILAARQEGLDALLALAHGHDNDELPIQDPKVEPTADGKSKVTWKSASTGKEMSQVLDPKNGLVEDQIAQYLYSLSTPEANMNYIINKVAQDRDNRKEDRDQKVTDKNIEKIDKDMKKTDIELKYLPQEKQANINQSNAATEASRASTKKTKEEMKSGDDKLPASVKEAIWYKDATPEQKAAFDKINTKSGGGLKVTNDQANGGFLITTDSQVFQMDDKGGTKEVKLPGATKEKVGSPEYQEYLEAYAQAKGNPQVQQKITERARKSGIVK